MLDSLEGNAIAIETILGNLPEKPNQRFFEPSRDLPGLKEKGIGTFHRLVSSNYPFNQEHKKSISGLQSFETNLFNDVERVYQTMMLYPEARNLSTHESFIQIAKHMNTPYLVPPSAPELIMSDVSEKKLKFLGNLRILYPGEFDSFIRNKTNSIEREALQSSAAKYLRAGFIAGFLERLATYRKLWPKEADEFKKTLGDIDYNTLLQPVKTNPMRYADLRISYPEKYIMPSQIELEDFKEAVLETEDLDFQFQSASTLLLITADSVIIDENGMQIVFNKQEGPKEQRPVERKF